MCLCIVLKVYGGHKYLFSFNIKASNIEWVLNCDTYSPCSLGVPIYPPPSPTIDDLKLSFDIIAISETWAEADTIDGFTISGYEAFHIVRGQRKGGV